MADRAFFRRGDHVQMDVTYPQRVGTVQSTTRPDDIRVSVLWDGSASPSWEWRHFLVKITKNRSTG